MGYPRSFKVLEHAIEITRALQETRLLFTESLGNTETETRTPFTPCQHPRAAADAARTDLASSSPDPQHLYREFSALMCRPGATPARPGAAVFDVLSERAGVFGRKKKTEEGKRRISNLTAC